MNDFVEVIPPKDKTIQKMLERGVPVWKAVFHASVNNTDDVPESYFSSESNLSSRNVKMWWVPGDGLLCYHKNRYFMVPSVTVIYCKFI